VRFLRFSRKRQDGPAPNFFTGFRRKHLFITTCIEKQYTQPLKYLHGLRDGFGESCSLRQVHIVICNVIPAFFFENNHWLGVNIF